MDEHQHFGAGRGLHLWIVVAVCYRVGCSDPAVQAGSSLTAPRECNLTIRGEPSPARGNAGFLAATPKNEALVPRSLEPGCSVAAIKYKPPRARTESRLQGSGRRVAVSQCR